MYTEIAILMNAFMLVAMTSFIVVTSLTVFKTLKVENAKNLLRSIFPKLSKFCFPNFAINYFIFSFRKFYI